jgi:hypothetical protein
VELNYHSDASHHVIKLQDENKHDIMMFVYDFLPNLNLPGPLLSEAADYINTNAEGVFLWVYVVKAELLRRRATGHNDKQIMHCLKCLPIEMVQFYELMLNRLEMDATQSDILDGLMIFRFVLFAIRPLTVAELQHILAVSSDLDILFELPLPEIDKYQINEFETRIMHCGGGFLEIKGTHF